MKPPTIIVFTKQNKGKNIYIHIYFTAADVSMALVHSDHSTRSSGAGSDHVISACTFWPFSSRDLIVSASIFFIRKLEAHIIKTQHTTEVTHKSTGMVVY